MSHIPLEDRYETGRGRGLQHRRPTPFQKALEMNFLLSVLLSALACSSPQGNPSASQPLSPDYLVRFLLYDVGPPRGVTVAGLIPEDRRAGIALAQMGPSALSHIERALTSIEREGRPNWQASGVEWLLYAYARIKGHEGYNRLRRMLGNSKLKPFVQQIERAMAVSLQVTSFRTSLHGSRVKDPLSGGMAQDALDQLILAWILGDQEAFEEVLSPRAKGAFTELLRSNSWNNLRQNFLYEGQDSIVCFGYRLPLFPGALRSLDPLQPYPAGAQLTYRSQQGEAQVEVELFKEDSFCGHVHIFLTDTKDNSFWGQRVQVDNTDIEALLRYLRPCVVKPPTLSNRH